MKNSLYVLDLTAMSKIFYNYIGTLVFTPSIIYFISTGKVTKSNVNLYDLHTRLNYVQNYEKNKIDFKQFENIDNYIEKLDKLTLENKDSVKINKFDIKSIKLPSGHLSYHINIITRDKKYRFNVVNSIREKKLSELKTYLDNNMYILK